MVDADPPTISVVTTTLTRYADKMSGLDGVPGLGVALAAAAQERPVLDPADITIRADWDRAACWNSRGAEEQFFATPSEEGGQRTVSRARTICRTCPIQRECLTLALTAVPHGLWGGLTAKERIALGGPRGTDNTKSRGANPGTALATLHRLVERDHLDPAVIVGAMLAAFTPAQAGAVNNPPYVARFNE